VPKVKLFREAEGRVRSLNPQEFERLHRELPAHLADMAMFSVATGLRQANVKGLSWQYVDLERKHAWVPGSQHKNGKPHSVPLNEMALVVLRKQLGRHPTRVFTDRYAHVAPEALQGTANRLDGFGGYENATPDGPTAQANRLSR
jgi:integrase